MGWNAEQGFGSSQSSERSRVDEGRRNFIKGAGCLTAGIAFVGTALLAVSGMKVMQQDELMENRRKCAERTVRLKKFHIATVVNGDSKGNYLLASIDGDQEWVRYEGNQNITIGDLCVTKIITCWNGEDLDGLHRSVQLAILFRVEE